MPVVPKLTAPGCPAPLHQVGQAAEAAVGADEDAADVVHEVGDRREVVHR